MAKLWLWSSGIVYLFTWHNRLLDIQMKGMQIIWAITANTGYKRMNCLRLKKCVWAWLCVRMGKHTAIPTQFVLGTPCQPWLVYRRPWFWPGELDGVPWHTALFMTPFSHGFNTVQQTAVLRLKWAGTQFHLRWNSGTRRRCQDGTPFDGSQTLRTETQLIGDSRHLLCSPSLHWAFVLLASPVTHDAVGGLSA